MLVLEDPNHCQLCVPRCHGRDSVLLSIPQQKWKIQENREPVTVDEEQDGKEGMDSSLRDDVCIEAVAEVDGVDIVTVALQLAR
jgi:hypothetical protein